jgi:RimJ/RimL family protein N-acetyltransferase
MFTCENLYFRRPLMEDVTTLCVLKNNENAAKLLGGMHHSYSEEDIVNWINFHNNNPEEVLFVVENTIEGKLIGHVGLYKIDNVAKKTEFGILIADDNSRGKGYGTKSTNLMVDYAFDILGMHKVTAEVLSENIASVTMFKKCGFSIDGCLRDDVYKNNRYYDVLSMSILAEERVWK